MGKIVISEISVTPVRPLKGLLAFTSFVLNNQFYVGDVAIYSCLNRPGYRLVYPSKVLPNGAKVQCFYPINQQAAQMVDDAVIGEFERLLKKTMEEEVDIYENSKR
jgi:DNA-binding cell septation regulator SpoVG